MVINSILFLILLYSIIQLAYSSYFFSIASRLSKVSYSRKTTLGSSSNPIFRIFVAGDSVGAGVGATSFEKSAAGRIATYFAQKYRVEFENISVSGKKMANLLDDPTPTEKQNLVVLIIGSNNLFRLTNLGRFREATPRVLAKYVPLTEKLIIIGPGRVADSDAIPFVLRPIYKLLGPAYAKTIREAAAKYANAVYVNPLEHSADFKKYGYTLAKDKFHPNDIGHQFWFDLIKTGF